MNLIAIQPILVPVPVPVLVLPSGSHSASVDTPFVEGIHVIGKQRSLDTAPLELDASFLPHSQPPLAGGKGLCLSVSKDRPSFRFGRKCRCRGRRSGRSLGEIHEQHNTSKSLRPADDLQHALHGQAVGQERDEQETNGTSH